MSNQLQALEIYRHAGGWAFDDEGHDLKAEPFVLGIPETIDRVLDDPSCKRARLIFSEYAFPRYDRKLIRDQEDLGGYWYLSDEGDLGWICPALLCYFPEFPPLLYVKVEALEGGR